MGEIVMPRLSDTMEEGTILRWLKRDGEHVRRGEELVEIETDKATMAYESDQDGILETIAGEGDTLAVGELIARVGGDGATPAPDAGEISVAPNAPHVSASPDADPISASPDADPISASPDADPISASSDADPISASSDAGRGTAPADAEHAGGSSESERVKASPLARRIALDSGVDLDTLSGSGPGGRIVKADVQAAARQAPGVEAGGGHAAGGQAAAQTAGVETAGAGAADAGAAPAPARALPDVATAKGETTTVELSRMQQTIARRMAESRATIPDFTLQAEVDMEECVKLRSELKRLSVPGPPAVPDGPAPGAPARGEAPTYNDMVVKACALALREHPRVNGSYRDGAVQLHARVNVGVAVAARDALVVPTVFDADEKSLGEIARETRALAERVRAATITPPELGGGTFTVSNLGMFGVERFSAIINPPQAAILAVGSVARRAVVRGEEVTARHTMVLTLACDHRMLYGAEAAEFLARVRELLQAPAALTL